MPHRINLLESPGYGKKYLLAAKASFVQGFELDPPEDAVVGIFVVVVGDAVVTCIVLAVVIGFDVG